MRVKPTLSRLKCILLFGLFPNLSLRAYMCTKHSIQTPANERYLENMLNTCQSSNLFLNVLNTTRASSTKLTGCPKLSYWLSYDKIVLYISSSVISVQFLQHRFAILHCQEERIEKARPSVFSIRLTMHGAELDAMLFESPNICLHINYTETDFSKICYKYKYDLLKWSTALINHSSSEQFTAS